jgi:sugar phosphate isomerase/epimerase
MTPLLSTRLFRRLPTRSDLALAAKHQFFDLELWMNDLMDEPPETARRLSERACVQGVRFPVVHLPTKRDGATINLRITDAFLQNSLLDYFQTALDYAHLFGTRVAVLHTEARESTALSRIIELANEHGIALAFETDVNEHSRLEEFLALFRRMEAAGHGQGLCIDLSRTQVSPDELRMLQRAIRVIEVSCNRDGREHRIPTESDNELRACVQAAAATPYVAYEVVSESPANHPPGDAELAMMMRRISAWHRRDDGRTRFEGPVVPF